MIRLLKTLWFLMFLLMFAFALSYPGHLRGACTVDCVGPSAITHQFLETIFLSPFVLVSVLGVLLWCVTLFQMKAIASRTRRLIIVLSFPLVLPFVLLSAYNSMQAIGLPTKLAQDYEWADALIWIALIAVIWPLALFVALPESDASPNIRHS